MSGRDPHLRARSDDRDASVEVIEAAFAAGQISAQDRELRVGNALRAETLGELDMLTRDLQPAAQPAPVQMPVVPRPPPQPPASQPPASQLPPPQLPALRPFEYAAPRRRPAPRRTRPVLALLALGLVATSIGASALISGLRDFDLTPGTSTAQADDPYDLTAAGMEAFLDLYEAKFGTRTALNGVFYPTYAMVDVPTPDGKPRHEKWLYSTGQWRRTSEPRANTTGGKAVDLARLNLKRLEANIEMARATLAVEEVDTVYVVVGWSGLRNSVSIYVQNKFSESAFLTTDLAGRELSRYPFAAG